MFLCVKKRNLFTHVEFHKAKTPRCVAATALKPSVCLAVLGGVSAPFISTGWLSYHTGIAVELSLGGSAPGKRQHFSLSMASNGLVQSTVTKSPLKQRH